MSFARSLFSFFSDKCIGVRREVFYGGYKRWKRLSHGRRYRCVKNFRFPAKLWWANSARFLWHKHGPAVVLDVRWNAPLGAVSKSHTGVQVFYVGSLLEEVNYFRQEHLMLLLAISMALRSWFGMYSSPPEMAMLLAPVCCVFRTMFMLEVCFTHFFCTWR